MVLEWVEWEMEEEVQTGGLNRIQGLVVKSGGSDWRQRPGSIHLVTGGKTDVVAPLTWCRQFQECLFWLPLCLCISL